MSEMHNLKGGAEKDRRLHRGVLALSHSKQSEDFFAEKTAGLFTQKTSSPADYGLFQREPFNLNELEVLSFLL